MDTYEDILFKEIYNKNVENTFEYLKLCKDTASKLVLKDSRDNILHLSYFNKKLFFHIYNLYPELINKKNNKGETPLFLIIEKQLLDEEEIIKILENYTELDEVSESGINIMDIALRKKMDDIIKYCINKKCRLTDLNYYRLSKMNIEFPDEYYQKEIKDFKQYKPANFSQEYLNAIAKNDINVFINNPNKTIKHWFYIDLLNYEDKMIDHVALQLLLLTKDLNIDVNKINTLIYNLNIDYLYFNDNEFDKLKVILRTLIETSNEKTFLKLLSSLIDLDEKDINHIYNHIYIMNRLPRKIKDWDTFLLEMRANIRAEAAEHLNEELLDQRLIKLDGKKIGNHVIVVPQKHRELNEVGKNLHICVGSGSYLSSIREDKANIIFLKKDNKIQYCIEVAPMRMYDIVQAKGYRNSQCPIEIVAELQAIINYYY